MSQPNPNSTLVAGPLQTASVAYKNPSYVGDRVFPILDKVDPQAKIGRYKKGAWFRDEAGIRAPGGRAPRGGFPTDFIDIATKEYAFAKEVTDEDRDQAKSMHSMPLKPDQDAIEFATDKVDMKKERRIASLILTGNWNGDGTGGVDAQGAWAAGASNSFLTDVKTGIKEIKSRTGIKPNKLLLDFGTFMSLTEEAKINDKIKYTGRDSLTADMLAKLLTLDEVLIGDAVFSTAKETKAGDDFTAQNIWEKNAGKGMGFLFYAPRAPGLKVPTAGYQARTAYGDGSSRRVMTWREEAEHQDVYECAERTDIVLVSADMGKLWFDTLLT